MKYQRSSLSVRFGEDSAMTPKEGDISVNSTSDPVLSCFRAALDAKPFFIAAYAEWTPLMHEIHRDGRDL